MIDAPSRALRILLVEDNRADARLVELSLEQCRGSYELWVATDGRAALDYLQRVGKEIGPPRPDLVLLDLNLPQVSGRDVLAQMKSDPQLRGIPVIVLSTSEHEDDVRFCYEHHAQSYVRKPSDLQAFQRAFRGIEKYWRGIATLIPMVRLSPG
jgi:chemotaxis family two-component system response regulator Rcp1